MSKSLTNNLNFNQNQAENLVLQNLLGAPSNPVPGQIYYDTNGVKQRAYYYSPTGNSGAPGWILIDTPTLDVDNYVDSVAFDTANGNLTIGRTGVLADIVQNLDGRYLTNITLTGDVTSVGFATTIAPTAISGKTDATLSGNYPTGTSYMLLNQDGALRRYSMTNLNAYITSQISTSGYVDAYTVTRTTVANGANISHFLGTTATDYTQAYSILGTASEVEVTQSGGDVYIGLPNNVNINNDLVVGGNLTVNGTTTTLNTTELQVEDNIITLNSGVTGAPTTNAGIEVERGTSANSAIRYNEANDRWEYTNDGTTYYNFLVTGEYAGPHPTQVAINVDGSGLQFVQDVTVNTLGHTTAVILGTIPTASELGPGVIEIATSGEHTAGTSTTLATNPAGVAAMIAAAISASGASSTYKTTITPANNSTTPVPHNLGTVDVHVELFDTATGASILADVVRTNINTVNISVGNLGTTTNIRVLIRTV